MINRPPEAPIPEWDARSFEAAPRKLFHGAGLVRRVRGGLAPKPETTCPAESHAFLLLAFLWQDKEKQGRSADRRKKSRFKGNQFLDGRTDFLNTADVVSVAIYAHLLLMIELGMAETHPAFLAHPA